MDIDGYELEKRRRINGRDDDASGRARKRVSRACDRCRVKKDKCDGLKPKCSPCVANSVECSYDPISKKRGLPEGYVRGLEKLWALSAIKIDGLEDAIQQIVSQEPNTRLWSNENSGEILHARWKESGILHELEFMLSRTEQDANTGRNKRKREDESDTFSTPEDPASTIYTLQPDFRILSTNGHESGPSKKLATVSLAPNQGATSLPTGANSIVEHYFGYTHCWLPIVEKHQVMRTCYEYAKGRASDANLAVLWAILAYTSQQLDYESFGQTPNQMLITARGFIPDESGPFELGHVQAMLLIALLHIGHGRWNSAWIMIGIASRAGIQLSSSSGPPIKRLGATLRACCMFDTLVAWHLMLRPHLHRSDVGELEYLEEDGSEDWEPWRAPNAGIGSSLEPAFTNSCFNRLVEVVLIASDIMTCDSQDDETRRSFIENRRDALGDLEGKYPTVGPSDVMLPHQFLLRALHLNTIMAISKRLFEANTSAESWARSANETLLLFSRQQQKHALAFRNVIPLLEVPLRAASYAAIATRPQLEALPGLTSYAEFSSKMAALAVQLSSTWATFSSLALLLHTDTLTNGVSLHASSSDDTFPSRTEGQVSQDWLQQANVNPDPSNDRNAWNSASTFVPDVIDSQLGRGGRARTLSTKVSMQTPKQSEMDTVMSGISNSTPAGLAMPAATETSPSFYGDEVDAIFHSFVGLDTTDWTDNRQKGLAEFGFADEDAFQAFCNDPERLLSTNSTANGQASFNAATEPWPPPGLYPDLFHPRDPQMEASQILQSLSGQNQSTVEASGRDTWWS